MSYLELTKQLEACKADQKNARRDFDALIKALKDEEAKVRQQLGLLDAGVCEDKVQIAMSVLYLWGSYRNGGKDRNEVLSDAIKYFISPAEAKEYRDLKNVYFGTKNYDRWYGQASYHEYGYGPKHGSTVFAVGLKEGARKRDLTDQEREACIYVMRNFETIENARLIAREQAA